MPATQRPARMRSRPCATSTRLLKSSGTTSATVPSATRSRNSATPGAPGASSARRIEPALEPRHHVEGDADAGERGAAEAAAGEVRIDDHVGLGQRSARQMMIGDQDVDARGARRRNAREA